MITATTFHVGEVQRNPYHLLLPGWMLDNVRRGRGTCGWAGQGSSGLHVCGPLSPAPVVQRQGRAFLSGRQASFSQDQLQRIVSVNSRFMREAIRLSLLMARKNKGGPFGAVVVQGGRIVGRGCNEVTSTNDPTAHAEIVAIRDACRRLKIFHLTDCTLYCSCEPCPMCLSAIYWARIRSRLLWQHPAGCRADSFRRREYLPGDRTPHYQTFGEDETTPAE